MTTKIQNFVYSPSVAENIKNFDPNVKIINVMCDPVRRIYSDFLHINRETPALATMDRFQSQVLEGIANIKQKQQRIDNENLSWEYLWHEEDFKFVTRTMTSFSKVILRSCYSIFIKTWYQLFGRYGRLPNNEMSHGNFLNVDGTRLYSDPGNLLVEVQEFLGLPIALTEDNFYFDESRGLYCSINFKGKPTCPGKDKGRSVNAEVPEDLKQKLREVLRPFTQEMEELENTKYDNWTW